MGDESSIPWQNAAGMDVGLLASVYWIILVAELPDKTALASLILATEYPPSLVFVGASAALTLHAALAVTFGQALSFLPARPVHVASGAIFLVAAVAMWMRSAAGTLMTRRRAPSGSWATIGTVFVVVFIAEWGDLTQIGAAALAAHYHAPLTVFAGSALGLVTVVALVVSLGNRGGRALAPDVTKKVAAVVFAIVGAMLIAR
jgi:Ca2+/H+ antiporter, TMEM165/GDT1 family